MSDLDVDFHKVLRQLEGGDVEDELATGWAELLKLVDERGKGGSLSLTVKVTPDKDDPSILSVGATVKVGRPPKPAEMWVTDGHGSAVRSEFQAVGEPIPGMESAGKPSTVVSFGRTGS
jgi:hypothetical protein